MEKPNLTPDADALVRQMLQATGPERMSDAAYTHLLQSVQVPLVRNVAVPSIIGPWGWVCIAALSLLLIVLGVGSPAPTGSFSPELTLPTVPTMVTITLMLTVCLMLLGLERWVVHKVVG